MSSPVGSDPYHKGQARARVGLDRCEGGPLTRATRFTCSWPRVKLGVRVRVRGGVRVRSRPTRFTDREHRLGSLSRAACGVGLVREIIEI